jgi:hypothetical protein
MINWSFVITSLIGIVLMIFGILCIKISKKVEEGPEAFTGRWIVKTTINEGGIIFGVCLILTGFFLLI